MRKPISKTARFEIFKRDGFACQYCGSTPPKAILHVDHIIPVAKGGTNDDGNLTTACSVCNGGKAARSLHVIPTSLAKRAALVAEQELQIKGYADVMAAQRARIESDVWKIIHRYFGDDRHEVQRSTFQSVKTFLARAPVHEIEDAVDTALAWSGPESARWRYFCGICWNVIKGAA